MNVLVTGHEGFIGKNLFKRLKREGHIVYGMDIKNGKFIQAIQQQAPKHRIDVIYHLAAQSRVQTSFDAPQLSIDHNVNGTYEVLNWARENDCKVVYAGSSAKHADPYGSPYATTKLMGEELCKMFRNCYDLNVEIARFWNVYGPEESLDPEHGNVIGIWRHNIMNDIPCQIVGDGEQRRDFIHVEDIVEGLMTIGEMVSSHEDAWELGTANFYSINDLARFFKERFQYAKFENVEDRKGNFKNPIMCRPDLYHKTGWEAKDKLRDYILNL